MSNNNITSYIFVIFSLQNLNAPQIILGDVLSVIKMESVQDDRL